MFSYYFYYFWYCITYPLANSKKGYSPKKNTTKYCYHFAPLLVLMYFLIILGNFVKCHNEDSSIQAIQNNMANTIIIDSPSFIFIFPMLELNNINYIVRPNTLLFRPLAILPNKLSTLHSSSYNPPTEPPRSNILIK